MQQVTDLTRYNNAWYKKEIGASGVKQVIWYYVNLFILKTGLFPFNGLKIFLLRLFGASLGRGVVIKPCVNIKYPWKLSIGDYSWIGEGVWIDNLAKVSIGKNVCISQGTMLLTGNHNYLRSSFDLMIGEISMEDGVWIGAMSMVCPGVNCASHAVLTACSVASTNLEAYTINRGNPAVVVRRREVRES